MQFRNGAGTFVSCKIKNFLKNFHLKNVNVHEFHLVLQCKWNMSIPIWWGLFVLQRWGENILPNWRTNSVLYLFLFFMRLISSASSGIINILLSYYSSSFFKTPSNLKAVLLSFINRLLPITRACYNHGNYC